jgi:hypothetical protein
MFREFNQSNEWLGWVPVLGISGSTFVVQFSETHYLLGRVHGLFADSW